MPPESGENLKAEVAGLSSRVDAVQESLEKNNEATAGLGEEVARLRGEINGTLPRIDRNVERLFDKVDERNGLLHACHERIEVQENEIGTLFKMANGKADKAANDEAHKRLWLFLRISLIAIGMGALGALILKALAV
jgi:predicted nuclease with TOPRIM domain